MVVLVLYGDQGRLQHLRLILGLPFILFFPGYTLIATLFPKQDDLIGLERMVLSLGSSIAAVLMLGLILNFTLQGIGATPILTSLIALVLIMSGLTFYRRSLLPVDDAYAPIFRMKWPDLREISTIDRALAAILVVTFSLAIASIYYVTATPQVGDQFGEMPILGYDGTPIGPFALANNQQWENPAQLVANYYPNNLKIDFILSKKGDAAPDQTLQLWVEVNPDKSQPSSAPRFQPLLSSISKTFWQRYVNPMVGIYINKKARSTSYHRSYNVDY
jgi:hypothetical protein